jgi:hypothetical protein
MDTYKATNTLNGKFYIGSTTNFEKRKKAHLNSKQNYPFQNALRKNPEAFEWEVWSDGSDEPILEQALLDMWFGKECCYNLNPKADCPPVLRGERNHYFGKSNSPGLLAMQTPEAVVNRVKALQNENFRTRHSERQSGSNNGAYGRRWWTSLSGETRFQEESPGEGWSLGNPNTAGERNFFFNTSIPWSDDRKKKQSEFMLENNPTKGKKWWVNKEGETQLATLCPGENWQNGRKWREGKINQD